MKTYNVICPICGHLNRNLILEETRWYVQPIHTEVDSS